VRILVVNPFAGTEFYGRENIARIARPDTEFDMVDISEAYPLPNNQWLYFRHMCTDGTLEKAMGAEDQGYHAVFISCNLDIGLYEARQLLDIPVTATLESAALVAHMMGAAYSLVTQLLDIPVTATLESAALVAHMMGAAYSLVTVDRQNGNIQKMLLEQYGLDKHFVSQRPFGIDASDLYVERTAPADIVASVVEAARACVEQDGAEVVIPGCTLAGSVLTHEVADIESVIGAPVVDGMVTGFKLAEMMADLHRAGWPVVSRRGFFEKPPLSDMKALRGFLDRPLLGGWARANTPDTRDELERDHA